MERPVFEESFKNAFEGAELSPSDSVWTTVELGLEKSSGGKMKRNLLLFQLLAAASTVFALGLGGIYFLTTQPIPTRDSLKQISQTEETKVVRQKSETQSATHPEAQEKSETESTKHNKANVIVNQSVVADKQISSVDKFSTAWVAINRSRLPEQIITKPFSSLVQPRKVSFKLPHASDPDAGMLLLARLKDAEKQYEKSNPEVKEKLWTSIGVGAGSYNPNASSSTRSLSTSLDPATASANSTSSGSSYSLSVSVAGKITRRFIIQGGVSYLNQNADFTSSASRNGVASLNDYIPNLSGEFAAASPYTVNSNLQFISIPVQAGYVIVDRAFTIQLNGGVATDLFMQNTLTPSTDNVKKVTQSAGADSPYRTVNFSGLVGTEFSYKVARHYRISLNPGLRYALNSIYKSEVPAAIAPVTVDVSLRFRYILK